MNVKLKYVALAVLLSLIGFSYGQNSPDYVLLKKDTVGTITKTIVRAFGDNSISYIEKGGRHYFTAALYTPLENESDWRNYDSVLLKTMEIDTSYTINDFKIINSTHVYCCGKYFVDGMYKAFIGFFEMSSFLNQTTVRLRIHDDFRLTTILGNVEVNNLSKFEFFYELEKLHIVAIGTTTNSRYCVLEMLIPSVGSLNGGIYNIGESSVDKEIINDIAVTDNYVVTVGSLYSNPYAVIRRYPRQSLFSNSMMYDSVYCYPSDENGSLSHIEEDIVDFLITDVQNDIVSIVSYWYNSNSAVMGMNLQGVLLRFFNVATNPEPTMIASISINQNYYRGGWKLREYDYNSTLQIFTLLQDMEESANSLVSSASTINFSNGQQQIVHSLLYPTVKLTSFDNRLNSEYNVFSGSERDLSTYFILVGDRINSQVACYGNRMNSGIESKSVFPAKKVKEGMNIYLDGRLSFSMERLNSFHSAYMVLSCAVN